MKILNCTSGQEKPVELGKKKIEPTGHLYCYHCQCYGNHLPAECEKENNELEELAAPYISYYCSGEGCGKRISDERVRALIMLGKDENDYKCVECAEKNDYRVKGFYTGVTGVNLQITKKLGREEHLDRNEEIYNTFINGGFSDI